MPAAINIPSGDAVLNINAGGAVRSSVNNSLGYDNGIRVPTVNINGGLATRAQIDAQLRGWWKVLAIGRQAKAIAAAVTRSETPNGKK